MTDSARCRRSRTAAGIVRRQRRDSVLEDAHAVAAAVGFFLEQPGALERPLLERELRRGAHLRLEFLEARKGLPNSSRTRFAAVGLVDSKLRTGPSERSMTAVTSALRLGK